MSEIRSLCVYCGSSNRTEEKYRDVAAEVGKRFAEKGITLVFGGGGVGLMGVVSDACMKAGGRVIGIMTEFLYEHEGAHMGISELHVVKTMHERKQMMFENSDGFLILPGGFGTLDEAFEILTWRQVGLHSRPIVWLDVFGYWEGLLTKLVPHMIAEGFVRAEDQKGYEIARDVSEIFPAFDRAYRGNQDFVSKWG